MHRERQGRRDLTVVLRSPVGADRTGRAAAALVGPVVGRPPGADVGPRIPGRAVMSFSTGGGYQSSSAPGSIVGRGYLCGKEANMALKPGFRLGIYVFEDVEIIDFAAPYGVFSVARRYDPELDVFLVGEAMRTTQAQAGLTLLPNYAFGDRPAMDAFLIPGGAGTRQEMHNRRLHEFVTTLPTTTLLVSVCTGSWIYGAMGLLDGLPATSRKEADAQEASSRGMVPIDRLATIAPACRISRARVVDAGRIITAGGIASGMELGFHLLRRAGYDETFVSEVARVMEYHAAYELYRDDIEPAAPG